jgi:N-acetylglucosamine kinase-like BadF-type ATPase
MPLLIGDIGGTSSRWALVPGKGIDGDEVRLAGFNPATGHPALMLDGLRKWAGRIPREALEVMAYGAGCGTAARAERMRAALAEVWPDARITVESDLLGAARGLFGTGMNAGRYDGRNLHTPMPSLGYILGDEGSGADIGKHLLRDALHGRLPAPLMDALFPGGLVLADVLDKLHRQAAPQAYLASFAGRLAPHGDEGYVRDLLAARFAALAALLAHYFPGPRLQVRACGSVALGFSAALRAALAEEGLELTLTVGDPLAGLLQFHRRPSP